MGLSSVSVLALVKVALGVNWAPRSKARSRPRHAGQMGTEVLGWVPGGKPAALPKPPQVPRMHFMNYARSNKVRVETMRTKGFAPLADEPLRSDRHQPSSIDLGRHRAAYFERMIGSGQHRCWSMTAEPLCVVLGA